MVNAEYYQDLLRPLFRDRLIVVFTSALAGIAAPLVTTLRKLGARRCLVIATLTAAPEVRR